MPDRPVAPADTEFERFAGTCAIAVGAGGLAYSITFLVVVFSGGRPAEALNAVILLLGGLLSSAVIVAVYGRLRETSAPLALWALSLGLLGAAGAAIHGGFALATAVDPPKGGGGGLPNAIDPRGLLTFGVTALATALVAWLIVRGGAFPRNLGYLGYVLAILLVALYVGRLTIFDPKNPLLLGVAAIAGFAVNPAWYVWLGLELRRGGGEETDGAGSPARLGHEEAGGQAGRA